PRASAVAPLAAAEVGVDRLAVEHEPRGQARHDRDERGPVRLAGGDELHHEERTAARMTSTGASTPVHASNDAAPCATRTSRPSITRAPAASAACAVAVRGYGRSTSVWPRWTPTKISPRSDVAFTTRSTPSRSGGHAPR